ncbi:MAG: hypothetical protein GXP58_00115 [Deltaproteobacteria bacterium]|nr:hypothetical protein [Deltaproteobacteria bacterium]
MIKEGTIVLLMVLFCVPAPLFAVDMTGSSRTYFQGRESYDGDTYLPLFEYLDFSLNDFAKDEYSFHFGGWARRDLNNQKSFDERNANLDLQYAYVDLHRDTANTVVDFGRVPVYEGVASESVDGLYARSDFLHGFGAAAYGGVPVETDFDTRSSDRIFGARVYRRQPGLYQVGISYLKERNNGSDFRTEEGLDLHVHPMEKVEVFGRSTYNGETTGWMEHSYTVTYVPLDELRLIGEFDDVDYKNYFADVDTHTTGVFDMGLGVLDPDEKMLELGLRGEYTLRDDLVLTALLRNYNYSVTDNANYYGAGLTWQSEDEMGGGCSLYRMDGQSDARRYYEFRVYAFKKYDKADVTLDLFNVHYDASINGDSNAFSFSVVGGYALGENSRVSANIEYGDNPTYSTDLRLFVKYIHNFDISPVKMPKMKMPKLALSDIHLPAWTFPFPWKKDNGSADSGADDSTKEKTE